MRFLRTLSWCAIPLFMCRCAGEPPAFQGTSTLPVDGAHPVVEGGVFTALSYNIAGLPEGISSSHPARNTAAIGAAVRGFDIVNVQEDFTYHDVLLANDNHPYRTPFHGVAGFGDGLNTLSAFPQRDFLRVKWLSCNGTDCLTPKGFSFSRIGLAPGIHLDLYNVHANAGTSPSDLAARRSNIRQLSAYIGENSRGNAVMVMGDTNCRYTRGGDIIGELGQAHGLHDAWVELARDGRIPVKGEAPLMNCSGDPGVAGCELVDKIFYRGNAIVKLAGLEYSVPESKFLDENGRWLSDHRPVAALMRWEWTGAALTSDEFGGSSGEYFNDIDALLGQGRPLEISLEAGELVSGIRFVMSDGTVFSHGTLGREPRKIALAPDELVSEIEVCFGEAGGKWRVFFIEARTNLGRSMSDGARTPDAVTYTAPPGWRIAGLHGRADASLSRLGVIYAPPQ